MQLRLNFEHNTILVQLGEHRGHLTLAESVIECVVDYLGRDTETRCGIPIHHQSRLQAAILLVTGNIAQFRKGLKSTDELGDPPIQLIGIRIFHAVLILRTRDTVFHGQVLYRLHVQRDALNLRQLRLQPADDIAGADLPRV